MKKFFTLLCLPAILLLAACVHTEDEPEPNLYRRIHRNLVNLENFRANATVEYISNRGSNTYETLQHAQITGEYRIEITAPEHVAGNVTVSDGTTIQQFSSRVGGRISVLASESKERSEIFLTSFIRNYLASQETSVTVSAMGEGQYTVLEAVIPGEHPYLARQVLWISNETLLPAKLVIYDSTSTERVIITYNSFEYNIVLDKVLFTL